MEKTNWDKIKTGDKQAFRQLFNEYYSSLCLYANSILGDLELSQDLVSDCFVRMWERRETITIRSSLKNYLLLAVRNGIYSYMRSPESRKSNIDAIIEKLENIPIEEYRLDTDEVIQQVYQLIEELPEQRRTILELAVTKGLSYKEIAEVLGISVNTVKTQMSRAYLFLRSKLEDDHLLLWFFLVKK